MKLLVGLGNPGAKYEDTRHNVGFVTIERIIQNSTPVGGQAKLKTQNDKLKFKMERKFEAEIVQLGEIVLMKPQTFMNGSGAAVQKVMQFYKVGVDSVYLIHDDLDIRLGEYKISKKGPKVHNGVNSVRQAIGEGFWYVRIGVDNRKQLEASGMSQEIHTSKMPGQKYVLADFLEDEKEVVGQVIEQVANEVVMRICE